MTFTRAVAIVSAAVVASAAAAQGTMTWSYGYDPEGNRTVAVDPIGNQSTFSYDPLQRRTSILAPLPSAGVGVPRIGIAYDGAGNVASVLDPRNLRHDVCERCVRKRLAPQQPRQRHHRLDVRSDLTRGAWSRTISAGRRGLAFVSACR